MTTIAATRTALAGDSMVSMEAKGMWYPAKKIRRVKLGIVGAAGDSGDCTRLMDWAETGFNDKKRPKFQTPGGDEDEAILLLLNAEGIFMMSTADPYPELIAQDFYAIGSGGKAAHAALYSGKSLDEAMDIAHAIDPYTRPPFDILLLKE
jgi:ATP-dependent protease HslVU (ClpYQ) peptidase subunit